jgi:hypothetical protein
MVKRYSCRHSLPDLQIYRTVEGKGRKEGRKEKEEEAGEK